MMIRGTSQGTHKHRVIFTWNVTIEIITILFEDSMALHLHSLYHSRKFHTEMPTIIIRHIHCDVSFFMLLVLSIQQLCFCVAAHSQNLHQYPHVLCVIWIANVFYILLLIVLSLTSSTFLLIIRGVHFDVLVLVNPQVRQYSTQTNLTYLTNYTSKGPHTRFNLLIF